MSGRVTGKVAIVTGAAGGIGEGIARRLAAEGAAVVIADRKVQMGEQVAADICRQGGQALFFALDLVEESSCIEAVRAAVDTFGHLDILVNNAAIYPHTELEDVTASEWDEVFDVNVRGVFFLIRAAIPHLRKQGGSITNIGTTLIHKGPLTRLAYSVSKGALLTMTKLFARELLTDRIRVNWITVGWVASPGEIELRNQTHGDALAFLSKGGSNSALGRLETPEDIAGGALYLASDDAAHVTGCELNISGGRWI